MLRILIPFLLLMPTATFAESAIDRINIECSQDQNNFYKGGKHFSLEIASDYDGAPQKDSEKSCYIFNTEIKVSIKENASTSLGCGSSGKYVTLDYGGHRLLNNAWFENSCARTFHSITINFPYSKDIRYPNIKVCGTFDLPDSRVLDGCITHEKINLSDAKLPITRDTVNQALKAQPSAAGTPQSGAP